MVWRPKEEWGTHMWAFIHTITIVDSDQEDVLRKQVDSAVACLRGLVGVVPCHKCAEHLKAALEDIEKQDIYCAMGLFRWGVDLHNTINRRLGKADWTVEEALGRWGRVI